MSAAGQQPGFALRSRAWRCGESRCQGGRIALSATTAVPGRKTFSRRETNPCRIEAEDGRPNRLRRLPVETWLCPATIRGTISFPNWRLSEAAIPLGSDALFEEDNLQAPARSDPQECATKRTSALSVV